MNHTLTRACTHLRTLCTASAEAATTKSHYRRKTVAELSEYLPDRGVGWRFTRLMWIRNGYEDSYWTITKVMEKNKGRLKYYGRLTWKGVEDPRERRVRTTQKRGWRYIAQPDQKNIYNNAPKPKHDP